MIHGHHTHNIQGVQKIKNNLVAYSLGNFCFDDCISPFVKNFVVKKNDENRKSFILSVEILDNKITKYDTIGINDDKDMGIITKNPAHIKKAFMVMVPLHEIIFCPHHTIFPRHFFL